MVPAPSQPLPQRRAQPPHRRRIQLPPRRIYRRPRQPGIPVAEARARARRQFGNVTRQKEHTREADLFAWLDTVGQDLRYALRALLRQPGYAATAIFSLALGIGANTAIFSIVDAVMLRTLPVEDPRALVQLQLGQGGGDDAVNTPIWEQIRDRQTAFSGTLAYSSDRFDLASGGQKQMIPGLWVSGDFFRVLGVPPLRGRVFTPADDTWGGGPAGASIVISHRFWQTHFAADPQITGRTVRLNRVAFTIIGVTPPWFTGLDIDQPFDVALPLGAQPLLRPELKQADEKYHWWLRVVGRLAPGQSLQQATERMASLAPEIFRATLPEALEPEDRPAYLNNRFHLTPIATGFSHLRTQYRTALYALLATTALVLLIACANIANLLLARAAARRRELSIRMAIGAGRWRLVRQLMTESGLLALFGALGGLVLAQWGSRTLLLMLSTAQQSIDVNTGIDWRVLAFTMGMAVLTTLLFGLAPALRATRGIASTRFRLGRTLVAVQVALSFVLLMGAGLFLGTLKNLLTLNPGFDRHNLLLVTLDSEQANYPPARRAQLHQQLRERIQSIPGVLSAAESQLAPISPEGWAQPVEPEGFPAGTSPRERLVFLNRVSPGYFHTLRTPILAGREFTARDTVTAPRVIIINESAARRFFPNANPIGKTIAMDKPPQRGNKELFEIIGIVKDARYNRLDEAPRRLAYLASTQTADPAATIRFEVRTEAAPQTLIPLIESAINTHDRGVSLQFRTMDAHINDSLLRQRMLAALSTIFGALALLLAMVGLYGVTSYGVTQRSPEIGLRIALGARPPAILWLVTKELLLLLMAGIATGLAITAATVRLTQSLLYNIQPQDPIQLTLATLILLAAALTAAYLPLRRATRLDPMTTLRTE